MFYESLENGLWLQVRSLILFSRIPKLQPPFPRFLHSPLRAGRAYLVSFQPNKKKDLFWDPPKRYEKQKPINEWIRAKKNSTTGSDIPIV